MKRFALKRITALVLALVMTLSLLPMNVWATEGEQNVIASGTATFTPKGIAIFTDLENSVLSYNGTLSESGGVVTVPCSEEGVRIFLATGDTLAKVDTTETPWPASVTFAERTENPTRWEYDSEHHFTIYQMTVQGQTSGKVNATITGIGQEGNETLTFCFDFDPQQGGGGDEGGDQPSGETFSAKGVYIFTGMEKDIPNYDGSLSEAGGVVTVSSGEGGIFLFLASSDNLTMLDAVEGVEFAARTENPTTWNDGSQNLTLYQMTVQGQASGKVNATITGIGREGNETLTFCFDFDPQQGGDNQDYLRSNTPVVPADILPTSAIPEDLDRTDFLGSVPIPGTDYFMNLIRHESGNLLGMKWDGNGLSQGMQVDMQLAIGFYKWTGQTMELVEGTELINLVNAFNNTLKVKLKLYTDDADNTNGIEYPWTRDLSGESDNVTSQYPCCTEYVFNHYSQGKWLLIASGTYNGTTEVVTRAYTNKEEQLVTGVDASSMTTVTEINNAISACIASLPENYNGRIAVELPAGTLEGYIVVPAFGNEVMLNGSMEGGELKTVLKGGIIVNSSDFHASCIQFIGAGRTSSATNNYAISGTARGGYDRCTFTGYDCAVYITHGLAGGENNFFYNNNVGIRVTDPDGLAVGNHQIYKTVFAYNGKDIEVLNADGESGDTKHYAIWDTIFIGSEKNVSVDESLWEILFMPKNAFDDGPLAVGVSRVDEPRIEGKVSATPYYGLSDAGKDALYGLQDANAGWNADYYLSHPTFDDDWIDHGRKFNAEWMCPERFDGDTYHIHGDHIRGRDHMTIKMMGDRGRGHECVATITLKPAAGN